MIQTGVVEGLKKKLTLKINRKGGSEKEKFGIKEVHPIYIYLLSLMAFKSWRNYIKNNERVRSISMKINRKPSFFQRISFFRKNKASTKTQKNITYNYEKFKDPPFASHALSSDSDKKEDMRSYQAVGLSSIDNINSKGFLNQVDHTQDLIQLNYIQEADVLKMPSDQSKLLISPDVMQTREGNEISLTESNHFWPNMLPVFPKQT